MTAVPFVPDPFPLWGFLDDTGKICVQAGNTAGAKSASPINDGAWHFVAMTRNATTGQVQVYVDNLAVQTATSATGVKTTVFGSLGRSEDTGSSPMYLRGKLDDVRVYDKVISATEVQNIRTAGGAVGGGMAAMAVFEATDAELSSAINSTKSPQTATLGGEADGVSLLATLTPAARPHTRGPQARHTLRKGQVSIDTTTVLAEGPVASAGATGRGLKPAKLDVLSLLSLLRPAI